MNAITEAYYVQPSGASQSDRFWHGALATLKIWRDRARQRRRLALLPPHQLADIGVTPAEAWREVNKPFWQA